MSLDEARALLRAREPARAASILDAHLISSPADAQGWFLAAIAHEDLGRVEDALAHYERALQFAPHFDDALHNRGLLLVRAGQLEQAEVNYRRYVELHPNSERAHSGLVEVQLARGRFQEAVEASDVMLARFPDRADALVRRGIALACLRRFAEARAAFDHARAVRPDEVRRYLSRAAPMTSTDLALSAENIYLWRQYVAQGECDWTNWDDYLAEMRRAAIEPARLEPAVAFIALHLPLAANERLAIASHIAKGIEADAPAMPPHRPQRRARIRIGIVSPDFREHLNAYLLAPLFELLDRSRFELLAYSLAADDDSAARARLRRSSDVFRDMERLSDGEAADLIRRDEVDILVDAAGQTKGGRFGITARRPVPLQVLYLGFPGSLGSKRVDYAIVDQVVGCSPEEWTEELVRLPSTYYLYDFRDPAPSVPVTRRDYGLPKGAFVYCAFHKAEKITPDAIDLWLEVLKQVPHAVLWLLALPENAQRNLRSHAAGCGVDPARFVFAPFDPRERYLARQRLGDLFLDAVHHSAMTTACDALAAGLPVLSLRGAAMSSRAGESLLRAAGLPELVAADQDAFARTAVEFAQGAAIGSIRQKLARNRRSAPLFDTAARVRELEWAFEEMFARALRGEPPRGFDL